MSIVLSYEDLDTVKTWKTQGWTPSRNDLMLFDWNGESLKRFRMGLGLTLEEVGNLLGVTKVTVRNIEVGQILNPMKIQMYGIVLERYYACIKGYIPAYRKIGTGTFKFAEELENAV